MQFEIEREAIRREKNHSKENKLFSVSPYRFLLSIDHLFYLQQEYHDLHKE